MGATRDAGTTQIVFPNGEIRYRDWMLPLNVQAQAVVKNFGDSTASFPVQLRIDAALVETSQVTDLLPQESALVQFPVTLPETGTHSIACSTALLGDVQPANDWIAASFETFESRLDVGPFPSCTVQVGDPFVFIFSVRNYGTRAEGAMLLLTISRLADSTVVYQSAESVFVLPTQSALVTFDPWADSVGVYKCLLRIGRMPPPLLDTLSCFITVVGSGVSERCSPVPEREGLTTFGANPITDNVRVQVCLPEDQVLRLSICDASGRCVADLARGAARHGAHVYSWPATRFPPGVYFVRLETANYSEARKLILTE
jgi:hypothetical protein